MSRFIRLPATSAILFVLVCQCDEGVACAEVQGAIGYGGGGHADVFQCIACGQLEFGPGLYDEDLALLACKVDVSTRRHRRR